jgi:hypothetical protein
MVARMLLDDNRVFENMPNTQKLIYIEACAEDLISQIRDFWLSYELTILLLEKVNAELKKEMWD